MDAIAAGHAMPRPNYPPMEEVREAFEPHAWDARRWEQCAMRDARREERKAKLCLL